MQGTLLIMKSQGFSQRIKNKIVGKMAIILNEFGIRFSDRNLCVSFA